MDISAIGKLNDGTLFTYKNLFGLFSGKTGTCQFRKINVPYILTSSTKSCWAYTIIAIFSSSA